MNLCALWECLLVEPLSKTVICFLIILKIRLTYDSIIPLLVYICNIVIHKKYIFDYSGGQNIFLMCFLANTSPTSWNNGNIFGLLSSVSEIPSEP